MTTIPDLHSASARYDILTWNLWVRDPTGRSRRFPLGRFLELGISTARKAARSKRAKMRVLVNRIVRIYGYPPDLQDAAVQNVLQSVETLSAAWAA